MFDLPPPPVLPDAPPAYTPNVFSGFFRQLRVFFVRQTALLETLFRRGGGQLLSFPTGRFGRDTAWAPTLTGTAETITLNTSEVVELSLSGGGIVAPLSSQALLCTTLRCVGGGAGSRTVSFWYEQDSTPISSPMQVVLVDTEVRIVEFVRNVPVASKDPILLRCTTTATDFSIDAVAAGGGVPAIAGVQVCAHVFSRAT